MTIHHAGPSASACTSLIFGRRLKRVRGHVGVRGLLASAIAVLAVVNLPSVASAAVSGTVAGTVFEDYNANGIRNPGSIVAASASATDAGVKNATVTVVDSTGATVGATTTNAAGAFSVPVTAATADVRVKIVPPGGFVAGPHGPDSASTVQFVVLNTPPATAVEVALARPGDYAPDAPPLLSAVQVAALNRNATPTVFVDQTTNASIVSSSHSARGTTAATTEATAAQTGSVWGLAQLGGRYAFTSAIFKRHARVGPGGMGAIYLTDVSAGPNASLFATIPNAGANPRGNESLMTADDWLYDPAAYPAVGKRGLGGMVITADGRSLYVVNLNSRSLWRVPLTSGNGGAPVAGTPVEIALPLALPGAAVGCTPDAVRPFGVASQNGSLWATLTCTGPAVGALRGYVYRGDPASGAFDSAPAFEMLLSGYSRGEAFVGVTSAVWNPWTPDAVLTWPATGSNVTKAQPLLSDVAFDANNDMTIGIKDRMGDQTGSRTGSLTVGDAPYNGIPAGDVLRACRNAADTAWVLESNAVCGTRVGAQAGNGKGPGGGEFYPDDYPGSHDEVSLGALLQLPGYGEIINTSYDPGPVTFRTEGYRFFANANAALTSFHELLPDAIIGRTGGSLGKAGGLGDMAALVGAAPLEIGNRVWFDTDLDGIQDPGEAPIAGVTVRLYAADGTTVLATAVTDAGGNYYFSNAPGTTTSNAVYGIAALTPETDIVVRLDNRADYGPGGPLFGYGSTLTEAGSDRSVESNGRLVGRFDEATARTGLAGVNDHTIDFGFVARPTYAVGDYVWFDTDKDGTQDPGEAPVPGVSVQLLDPATGQPAKHEDGTTVTTVTTDANGHYSIDFLPPGNYQVQFSTFPTCNHLTTQGSGGGSDSNPAVATGLTPTFTIGPLGPADMRPVVSADGVIRAVAINPTIDAGLFCDTPVTPGTPAGGSAPPPPTLVNPVPPAPPRSAPARRSLTLSKTVNHTKVRAGGRVTFTIRVTNPSTVSVSSVRVCDRLPSGLAFVSASPKARRSSGRYCWSVGTLAARRSRSFKMVVRTLRGVSGCRTNVATVTGSGAATKTDGARVCVLRRPSRAGGVTG